MQNRLVVSRDEGNGKRWHYGVRCDYEMAIQGIFLLMELFCFDCGSRHTNLYVWIKLHRAKYTSTHAHTYTHTNEYK